MASTDSAAATPTGTPAPTPRYVPGAPPPAPPSKSKKKKAKSALKNLAAAAHEAALSDHAPDVEDVKAGKVDPSLLANPPPPSSGGQDTGNNTDADEAKAPEDKSVVAESIAKRVRALGKKAQRLQEYKNQKEELNPDQKAALEGLPLLESNIKELEGIKKTVETLEAGQRRALAQQRNEERKAAERRVTEATQHAEASLLPRITSLLSFLALRNLLVHATPSDISISDTERNAIISAGDALLAHPPVGHVEEIVKGFLTGAGSWEDIEYSRLLEITAQFAAPRAATPIPDPSIPLDPTTTAHPVDAEPEAEEPEAEAEPEVEPEAEIEQPEEAPEAEQPVVLAFGQPPATGGGFHFMQESELDVPATMTESQEWVSVQQHEGAQEEEEEEVAPEEDVGYVGTEEGAAAGADAAGGAPLDWAAAGDEHDELPDIGGLQATFGGSGSATPIAPQVTSTGAPTTGKSVTIDDDGFTAIPSRRGGHGQRGSYGGRGRGGPRGEGFRGRGGYRGEGGEGGYRGRGRGSWQGGEGGEGGEGGYRGRGGYRGGEGGEGGYRGRGGYRSEGGEGGEGGYRGRGRGSWQGGEGGEGGEGGYRGRGGYRGGEGGEGGYRGRGGYRNEGGEGGEGGYRGRGRGSWQGGEGGEGRGGRGGYRGERRGSGFRGGRGGSGGATPTAEAPGAA